MARPRTFDETRAVRAAMLVFWKKGYEAATTEDLCEATGLGRSSIYNTFTSKHDLFLRTLEHYTRTVADEQIALLEDAGRPPADRLRALLSGVVDIEEEHRQAGRGIGCFGVNSSVELAGRDEEAAAILRRDQERRLAAYAAVIAAGRSGGEVSGGRGPDELALFLNAAIAGMRVSARGGADRESLESIAATALDALIR